MVARLFARVCLWTNLLAAGAGVAQSGEVLLLPDPSQGWRVFTEKGCLQCHAIRGEGGSYGPDLGLKVFALDRYQIAGAMWNHSPTMTGKMRELGIERPSFADDEMGQLVAFLYFLNYFDEPGEPVRGKELFAEKGCATCHAIAGEGGNKGPGLDQLRSFPFPVAIAQSMWNHGPDMVEMMREEQVPVPTFSGREVIDLFAYVRSISAAARERAYTSPGNSLLGKELFAAKGCSRCHRADSQLAPDLRRIGAQYSVTQIAGLMWNHALKMWERMEQMGIPPPVFADNEMADIIAYIYSIRFSGRAGDATRGRDLFADKGCAECHKIAAQGHGTVGPDLAGRWETSPLEVAREMWNHADLMAPQMARRQIPWPRFEGDQMADLIAFLAQTGGG